MNLTPKSFPVSSPLAQALSGDVAALDGTPDYSSSSHTEHLHPQAMVNDPQQLSGLGILHGGMGIPLNRLRGCPTSESLQLPSDGWGDQTIPGQSFPDATLNGGGFPAPASYEQYDSRPPVSSAAFGISNLASHSMGASLCYSPNVGLRGSGNTFYDQYSGSWPVTPRSQTSTPSGNSARVKGEIDRAWDASIPHRPAFPDARDETPVHGMTHLSRATISDSFFTPQMSNGQSGDRLFELDPNVGPPTERERRDSTQTSSIGSPRSDITSRRTSRRQNSPVVNGLQCTVCGYLFTRRSNCREHMKKHDPNQRRDYGCETCGRTFGRRTDLKRHVDSIHHGTRRFGCDQCGRRFTRQDTLTRHCADGCRRKQRKSHRSQSPTSPLESIHSCPSPPSAVESQPHARHSESSNRSYAMRTLTRPNTVNSTCTISDA